MSEKCFFCGGSLGKGDDDWTEEKFIDGLIHQWREHPEGTHPPDCDKCWGAMQRVKASGNEILIRDNDWNWRQVWSKELL